MTIMIIRGCPPVMIIPAHIFRCTHGIFLGNADIWQKLLVLMGGKTVELGEILWFAIYTAMRTILINVPHLPWTKSKFQQGCTVCRVRVEIKQFYGILFRSIIILLVLFL